VHQEQRFEVPDNIFQKADLPPPRIVPSVLEGAHDRSYLSVRDDLSTLGLEYNFPALTVHSIALLPDPRRHSIDSPLIRAWRALFP